MNVEHEVIRYTADVILLSTSHDGQLHVLLIRRRWDPYAGRWALPGGHVDRGETAREAAVRELREETGISVGVGDLVLVGVYDAPDRDPRGRYVSVAFVSVVPDSEPVAGDDAVLAQWQVVGSLPADGLAFDHRVIVDDAVRFVNSRSFCEVD